MKNKIFKSTLLLMASTVITKFLGFIISTLFKRIIKDGISIYALIMPTVSLISAIASLSMPYAISIIVSRGKYKSKEILTNIVPITILIDIIIITIFISICPFISNNLLKNQNTLIPLITYSLIIPLQTISGILKGYYFGKQNMLPSSISNVLEQVLRLTLIILIIPSLYKQSVIKAIVGFIIITGASEILQIIIYLIMLPKKINIKNIKVNNNVIKDTLNIAVPNTTGKIIGNICYFLEPIILTNILLLNNYSYDYIVTEYAVYNSYVIPLLCMPTFITQTINTSCMPVISKNINDKKKVKSLLRKCILLLLFVGYITCIFIYMNASTLLSFIYNTTKGIPYIKLLSIIFPLFYIESFLQMSLNSLNQNKFTMKVTLYTCIIKLIILFILCNANIGIYALIISEIFDIIFMIIIYMYKLRKINYI